MIRLTPAQESELKTLRCDFRNSNRALLVYIASKEFDGAEYDRLQIAAMTKCAAWQDRLAEMLRGEVA